VLEGWTEESARALLGAMTRVAQQHPNGATDAQRGLVHAAAQHVFGLDLNIDELSPTDPDELHASLGTAEQRDTAIQFLILVPYADTSLAPGSVAAVDQFAAALGTQDDTLRDLHHSRDKHLKRLLLDFGRRSTAALYGDHLAKSLMAELHQYLGDAPLAERYEGLESYPEGTLGHTFHTFYRQREFPLPGEKKSLGEILVNHDCCHILGGFNTDGTGEIDVAGFEAGMKRSDFGYELLMQVLLDFQLGYALEPGFTGFVPRTGELDPDQMMVGIHRGLGCNTDILDGSWDFWAVADQPVDELREQYSIEGVAVIDMPVPAHPAGHV
jgi:hypothetical protein